MNDSTNGNGRNGLVRMAIVAVVSSVAGSFLAAPIATARLEEQIKSMKERIGELDAERAAAVAERIRVRGVVAERGAEIAALKIGYAELHGRLTVVEREQARRTPFIPKKPQ